MRAVILVLCLFASPVFAADSSVSLQFRSINVVQLLHAVYSGILKKDFVISDGVLQLQQSVSVNVGRMQVADVPALMKRVLAGVGIESKEVAGLTYFDLIAKPVGKLDAAVNGTAQALAALPVQQSASSASFGLAVAPGLAASAVDLAEGDLSFEVYRPRFRTADYLGRASGLSARAGGDQGLTDVVVVRGSAKRRVASMALLAALDVQAPVVDVRAVVVEVSLSDDSQFSLGALLSMLGGKLSFSVNAGASVGNFARLKVGGLSALVGAMAGDSRFKFRSQPSMRLMDSTTGKLQVGTDTPVRGALTTNKDGTVLQAVEYRSSGLVLNVLPRILSDRVQATISQEISSFARTVTSGIDSPTLNKRSISASVDVEAGEVVVLAGLEEETSTDTRSGLPFFKSLSRSNSTSTTHLVVLLEFTRVRDPVIPAAKESSSLGS